jgi:hypothetical protein
MKLANIKIKLLYIVWEMNSELIKLERKVRKWLSQKLGLHSKREEMYSDPGGAHLGWLVMKWLANFFFLT